MVHAWSRDVVTLRTKDTIKKALKLFDSAFHITVDMAAFQ